MPLHLPLYRRIGSLVVEIILWFVILFLKIFDVNRNNYKYKYIAVFEPCGLGDSITILGLNKILKQKYPKHKTIAIINDSWELLFRKMSNYDEVITVKLPWTNRDNEVKLSDYNYKFFKEQRARFVKLNIEYAYELRGDIRNQLFLKWIGVERIISWDRDLAANYITAGLFLSKKKKLPKGLNREQLNYSLIGDIVPNEAQKNVYKKTVDLLLIHIGAGWKYRRWDKFKWEKLINIIGSCYPLIKITVISDKEDEIYDYLLARSESRYCIKITSLIELYDVVNSCDIFIGLDSGVTHLASFLQKPIIDLLGPGQLPLWEPNAAKKIIIHHQNDFPCAPCQQKECIRPMGNCMDAIEPDEVFEAFQQLISGYIAN
jgi:ADP-heptose:LPS heptosyltransferase